MDNLKHEILKASIKDSRCEAKFTQSNADLNYSSKVTEEAKQIVHADMQKAFDRLKVHLVCITEQPEASSVDMKNILDYNVEELSNYVITGYVIGGTDENSGVTIIGQKLLKTGQVLNLISPFTKYEDVENYSAAGELMSDIEGCNFEVKEYLFNGKWGIKQQEIDFDAPTDAEVIIDAVEDHDTKASKSTMRVVDMNEEEETEMSEAV